MLDGDVKKTATSIKFQSLKQVATPTVDILTNNAFDYENNAIVDAGNKQEGTNDVDYILFLVSKLLFLKISLVKYYNITKQPKCQSLNFGLI